MHEKCTTTLIGWARSGWGGWGSGEVGGFGMVVCGLVVGWVGGPVVVHLYAVLKSYSSFTLLGALICI